MASGWNSESEREAMLRRVAIVLSSLPAPIAAHLLGSIEPESKRDVRRTMTSLSDVDPLERQRALRAFKVSVEQTPGQAGDPSLGDRPASQATSAYSAQSNRGANVQPSPNPAPPHQASTPHQMPGMNSAGATSRVVSQAQVVAETGQVSVDSPITSPLSFLGDLDEETLVRMLAIEHPQAVALVLASIDPTRAACVVPRLDPKLQNDALQRIGRLGEIPEAAALEVAEHFRSRLEQQSPAERTSNGRRALNAILAAMPSPREAVEENPVVVHRGESDPGSIARPSESPEPRRPPSESGSNYQSSAEAAIREKLQRQVDVEDHERPAATPQPIQAVSFPTSDVPAVDLTYKLMAAHESSSQLSQLEEVRREAADLAAAENSDASTPTETPRQDFANDSGSTATRPRRRDAEAIAPSAPETTSDFDSTDAIHQHLLQLPAAELCRALGQVETRNAILALCGLPNQVTEAALANLPRAQAKKVRGKMHALGSLSLRDIDLAKEAVAKASLATTGDVAEHLPVAA